MHSYKLLKYILYCLIPAFLLSEIINDFWGEKVWEKMGYDMPDKFRNDLQWLVTCTFSLLGGFIIYVVHVRQNIILILVDMAMASASAFGLWIIHGIGTSIFAGDDQSEKDFFIWLCLISLVSTSVMWCFNNWDIIKKIKP